MLLGRLYQWNRMKSPSLNSSEYELGHLRDFSPLSGVRNDKDEESSPLRSANEHLKHDLGHTSTFVGLRRSKCGGTLGSVEGSLDGWTFRQIQLLLHVERSARREIQEVVRYRRVALNSFCCSDSVASLNDTACVECNSRQELRSCVAG